MLRTFLFAMLSQKTTAGDRIRPMVAPQGTPRPLIVYQEIAGGSINTAQGAIGVNDSRIQITAFADTPDEADDLLEQIRMILNGFKGTAGGVTVQHCLMVPGSKRDIPYVSADNEQQTEFAKAADFKIFNVEDIPTF